MQYDINIMGDPGVRKARLALDNTACSGVQKLVQRILILLFTDSSDPVSLGLGTSFGINTQSASADTQGLVNQANIAMTQIRGQLEQTTPEDAPADERLSTYAISAENTDRGTVELLLSLTTMSGLTTKVTLPISKVYV